MVEQQSLVDIQKQLHLKAYEALDLALQFEAANDLSDALTYYRTGIEALRKATRLDWPQERMPSLARELHEKMLRNLTKFESHYLNLETQLKGKL